MRGVDEQLWETNPPPPSVYVDAYADDAMPPQVGRQPRAVGSLQRPGASSGVEQLVLVLASDGASTRHARAY